MTHCQVYTQVILINIIIQNKPIFTIKRGTHFKKRDYKKTLYARLDGKDSTTYTTGIH